MHRFMDSQKPLIDRYGLLPGITVALFIVVLAMWAIVSASWVAVALVLGLLFVVTAVIVWIIMQVADDDEQPRTH